MMGKMWTDMDGMDGWTDGMVQRDYCLLNQPHKVLLKRSVGNDMPPVARLREGEERWVAAVNSRTHATRTTATLIPGGDFCFARFQPVGPGLQNNISRLARFRAHNHQGQPIVGITLRRLK